MTKNSPDNSPDKRRSKELAAEINRLVEQHRAECEKKHGTKPSIREIERDLDLEHPALLNIIKGKNNLLGDRSKWSLFKIGIYLGTDFGESWLSEYISQRKAAESAGQPNDTPSRISPSEETISTALREYNPEELEELLKLLNSMKSLPPEERIKKFKEWRTQGNLQATSAAQPRTGEVRVLKAANSARLKKQGDDASSLALRKKRK